jgi:hypothetical protein
MTYFMNFFHLFGTDALTILPSWEHKPGENCIYDTTSRLARAGDTDEMGEGTAAATSATAAVGKKNNRLALFDVASFGQWYSFAANSTNGFPPRHVADSMRKGRFLDATPPPPMTWEVDSVGRRRPVWKDYHLVTLHVHAKNLNKFRSLNWDL